MERITQEADFGLEDWEETLFFVKSDPNGAYNILDIAKYQGESEFDEILKNVALRLAAYEDTGLEPETISKIRDIVLDISGNLDRLRELAQADREGRCVVLPAPLGNTVYRIEYVEQCQGRYEIGICKHRFDILFYAMECRNFGKTVFLTREEAEAALATDC